MKLSLLIPARNEGAAISGTVYALSTRLHAESIPHEILAVEDHSTDSTVEVLERLTAELREFRWIRNSDRAWIRLCSAGRLACICRGRGVHCHG